MNSSKSRTGVEAVLLDGDEEAPFEVLLNLPRDVLAIESVANSIGELGKPTSAVTPVEAVRGVADLFQAFGVAISFKGDGKKRPGGSYFLTEKPWAAGTATAKSIPGKNWLVQDGAIYLNAEARNKAGWQAADCGDIVTDEAYANYELRLEWKIAACGNSGIIYNVVEDLSKYEYVWQTGPEMQVLDNACHPSAMIEKHRAGDLYDLISCKYETVKPGGQWNKVRLVNRNGKVEHWLNGRKMVEVDMTGEEWAKLIAGSKFKDMPAFGKATSGKISLQDHGDKVWYRNVKVRELR